MMADDGEVGVEEETDEELVQRLTAENAALEKRLAYHMLIAV